MREVAGRLSGKLSQQSWEKSVVQGVSVLKLACLAGGFPGCDRPPDSPGEARLLRKARYGAKNEWREIKKYSGLLICSLVLVALGWDLIVLSKNE